MRDMARKNSNPKVPGCHGYAAFNARHEPYWTGRVELIEEKLLEPLSRRKWALKFAQEHGRKPRCFANSMSDLFHKELSDSSISQVFAVMSLCPEIDFLVLTKRADRMEAFFKRTYVQGGINDQIVIHTDDLLRDWMVSTSDNKRWPAEKQRIKWPIPNVHLGVSVEDQKHKDRIDHLRRTPAAIRFLSLEPLLEDLGELNLEGISQAIVGGESGPSARPFDLAWARSIRDQCKAAGVAYYFKQAGSNPVSRVKTGEDSTGPYWRIEDFKLRDKKGGAIEEMPEDLRIREYPR